MEDPFIAMAPWSTLTLIGARDSVLSTYQIEQTVGKQMTDVKLRLLYSNTGNQLILCKKSTILLKNVIHKMYLQIIYI